MAHRAGRSEARGGRVSVWKGRRLTRESTAKIPVHEVPPAPASETVRVRLDSHAGELLRADGEERSARLVRWVGNRMIGTAIVHVEGEDAPRHVAWERVYA